MPGRYRRPADRPGLQGERTELAWERTAFGLLAAGGLLLIHHVGPGVARVLLVVCDVGLGLLMIWFGRRRGAQIRALRSDPAGRASLRPARAEVLTAGVAAAVLAVGTALVLVLRG